jgi:hypothetical protein
MRLLPAFFTEKLGSVSCADVVVLKPIAIMQVIKRNGRFINIGFDERNLANITAHTEKPKRLTFPSSRKNFPATHHYV